MTIHTHTPGEHESAYDDGLLANDAHWAFGTSFEDPLVGVDTSIPGDVDAGTLATYCLMLADDALVLAERLSEWCSRAPDLEEDVALANIALDLLGQARLLLTRAGAVDPCLVPELPEGSPVPAEDALAFFREAPAFRNVRLAEVADSDFADAIVRLVLVSTWRLALFERLTVSRDRVLAALAAKGVKELTYHRDFAAQWFVMLAGGTDESRRRVEEALRRMLPLWPELFTTHPVEAAGAAAGVGVDPGDVGPEADGVLDRLLEVGGLPRPDVRPLAAVRRRTGRDGVHTEALSRLLAEMQSVARAHPKGRW